MEPQWPQLKKPLVAVPVVAHVPLVVHQVAVEVDPVAPIVDAPVREIINLMSDSSESAATIYTRTVIDDGSNETLDTEEVLYQNSPVPASIHDQDDDSPLSDDFIKSDNDLSSEDGRTPEDEI